MRRAALVWVLILCSGRILPAQEPPAPPDPVPLIVPEPVVEPPPRRTEPLPPPRPERRRRMDLVITGAGILAGVWLSDRLLAQEISQRPVHWVPLVGPWFLLSDQRQQQASGSVLTVLALDGLLQAAGATLSLVGLFLYKERQVLRLPPPPKP